MTNTAIRISQLTEAQATRQLNDRISRTRLLIDNPTAYELALDSNARLITELREAHIWPAHYAEPADFQPIDT